VVAPEQAQGDQSTYGEDRSRDDRTSRCCRVDLQKQNNGQKEQKNRWQE
jgi:hypothetical protein